MLCVLKLNNEFRSVYFGFIYRNQHQWFFTEFNRRFSSGNTPALMTPSTERHRQ